MILSQLIDAVELEKMSPEQLRSMILRLDEQIKVASSGEKILFSIEANVIGVRGDQPAGEPEFKESATKLGRGEPRKQA